MTEIVESLTEWQQTYRENFLAHFQATGETDFKRYNRVKQSGVIQSAGLDLSQSRLVFITSAGSYIPKAQTAFDAENPLGDYSIRLIPQHTPLDALAFAHTHYDHAAVDADPQVLVPLRHLEALAQEGLIGALAENVIGYMGYQPDVTRIVHELVPSVVEAAQRERAHAALLVPA